eukprot:6835802-Pyramimonas_sp.AAC.1
MVYVEHPNSGVAPPERSELNHRQADQRESDPDLVDVALLNCPTGDGIELVPPVGGALCGFQKITNVSVIGKTTRRTLCHQEDDETSTVPSHPLILGRRGGQAPRFVMMGLRREGNGSDLSRPHRQE